MHGLMIICTLINVFQAIVYQCLEGLSVEVRRFLGMGNLLTRLATRARLYLEFPDVGSMHYAVAGIKRALPPMTWAGGNDPVTEVDEGTVEIEFMGISIMLVCKERMRLPSGRTVGYNGMPKLIGPGPQED